MTTSAQLEREADATRAHIAETLDELRGRISPGQVVDQLVDYARDGSGGMFFRNLRDQVVDNPLPLTLMGAGLAWLMMAGRHDGGRARMSRSTGRSFSDATAAMSRRSHDARDAMGAMSDKTSAKAGEWADDMKQTAGGWADATRSGASDLGERASAAGSRLQDGAAAAASRVGDTVSSAADTVSSAYASATGGARRAAGAIGDSASDLRESAGAASRSVMDFLQEQPLVLAGIGLALGAALGAALPSTQTEDELMGETSDAMKNSATRVAEQQLDKGQAMAENAWEGAAKEIKKEAADGKAAPTTDGQQHGAQPDGSDAASLVPADRDLTSQIGADSGQRKPVHGSD